MVGRRKKDLSDGRKGRFLTSNVNITIEEDGDWVSVPIADRFTKFETKQCVCASLIEPSLIIGAVR